MNYVYGLGGRDICVEDFAMIYDQLFEIGRTGVVGEVYRHFGQREQEV
jgi:pyruvate ferredoxin oxidoreductase alpha subunit